MNTPLVRPADDLPYGDPARATSPAEALLLTQFKAGSDALRADLIEPMTVYVDGRAYTVATNGHRMLALDGHRGFPKATDAKREHTIVEILSSPPALTATVPLAELRAFVHATTPDSCTFCHGDAAWKCKECDGLGTVECSCSKCDDVHDSDCDECDGEGTIACEFCTATNKYGKITPVKIGELHFNRANMIPALRYLPGERVALHLPAMDATGVSAGAHLIGDGWHVVLMPLRAHKYANAPVFALPAPPPSRADD